MVPRGSNGAGQAIIDARCLAGKLKTLGLTTNALQQYDKERVEAKTRVVLTNRKNPQAAILREVFEKSGYKPYEKIEDVQSRAEIEGILHRYKQAADCVPDSSTTTQSLLYAKQ